MMITEEQIKHQQAYARTVIASILYFCLDKKPKDVKGLGDLLDRFDRSEPHYKGLIQELGRQRGGPLRYGDGIAYNYRKSYRVGSLVVGGAVTAVEGHHSHLCVNGMPYFRSPQDVMVMAEGALRSADSYSTWYPKLFSQVLTDPVAFTGWCRERLVDRAGKAGARPCTRFPKDPTLPTERSWSVTAAARNYGKDPGRYVTKDTFLFKLVDSYILQWWDDLEAAGYDAGALPLKIHEGEVVGLVGELSEPIKQNSKASSADVAEYINRLLAAVRRYPVACGLMASGRKPDDPVVQMFVTQPSSISRATNDFDSSAHSCQWMDSLLTLLTKSRIRPGASNKDYGPHEGAGVPMAELLQILLDLASEQAARHRNGDPLELFLSSDLAARVHDAVTDPETEMAMEMSLVFPQEGRGDELQRLGQIALSVCGHPESAAIRKTVTNRIKATNQSVLEG